MATSATPSPRPDARRRQRDRDKGAEIHALTMRELGKLTADQLDHLDHPVPVTSNGLPVAWLTPLEPGERRRAELIAAGRLRPGRPRGLTGWSPLPSPDDSPTLSEMLIRMREQERT